MRFHDCRLRYLSLVSLAGVVAIVFLSLPGVRGQDDARSDEPPAKSPSSRATRTSRPMKAITRSIVNVMAMVVLLHGFEVCGAPSVALALGGVNGRIGVFPYGGR